MSEKVIEHLLSLEDIYSRDLESEYVKSASLGPDPKKSMERIVLFYKSFNGNDYDLDEILDIAIQYTQINDCDAYAYGVELSLLGRMIEKLEQYGDIIDRQMENLNIEIKKNLHGVNPDRMTAEQKLLDRKYVGMSQLIGSRTISFSVLYNYIDTIMKGNLSIEEIENSIGTIEKEYIRSDSPFSLRQMPVFVHEPDPRDIGNELIDQNDLYRTIAILVSKNPQYIFGSIRDNQDGTVFVRLWREVSGEYTPEYIRLRKSDVYDKLSDYYGCAHIWPLYISSALEMLGYDIETDDKAVLISCIVGAGLSDEEIQALCEDDTDDFEKSEDQTDSDYVNGISLKSHMKCLFDIYGSSLLTQSILKPNPKEFENVMSGITSLMGEVASAGIHSQAEIDRIMHSMKPDIEAYRNSVPEVLSAMDKQRLRICDLIERYVEMYFSNGPERSNPYEAFSLDFSIMFTRAWYKSIGMDASETKIERKAREFFGDKFFRRIVNKMSIMSMYSATDKMVQQLVEKYNEHRYSMEM